MELGETGRATEMLSDVAKFTGHPLRLFLDRDMNVTLCTFDGTLDPTSRLTAYTNLVSKCSLSIADLMKLISNGFKTSFQPKKFRRSLFRSFWSDGSKNLKAANFHYLRKKHWYPDVLVQQEKA